ncbi:hypothetical protein J5X84_01495 [Streptosporangiaceae bacterium NEAU-GS5]|nr:hypothetical protein [Streptosporangiaceae bacterium NEAU-GS5]
MTHEEKRAWIRLVVAVIAYGVYVILILTRADGRPLPETPYAATLLWSVGVAIVASMIVEIAVNTATPGASRATDERDKEILRRGDLIGQSFVIIGAVAAMLMALGGWDRFWIANVIYLCFVLSAILGGVAKVVLYRTGMPQW